MSWIQVYLDLDVCCVCLCELTPLDLCDIFQNTFGNETMGGSPQVLHQHLGDILSL